MRWIALLLVAACGSDAHRTTPLASDGTHLRDADGRIALLRGINARVDGIFDGTFADGRTPIEPIPPLADADCTRMHDLGLDFLRLPINWSAIQPARDTFDESYLDRVEVAVRCADAAGIYVMIDLHQDAYSKEIGEDGAPLWAIQPPPTMLLQGPLTDLADRRLSAQVTMAFTTFFDPTDASGLQADFGAMLEHVAARWADDPAVIGFELFNEPPMAERDVDAFSVAMAARVREVAPDKLVMFEPSAVRNLFDFVTPSATPFPTANAVYAPHVYTFVFDADPRNLQNLVPSDLEGSVSATRDEATAWHTPLMIDEFGIGPNQANSDLWMGVEAELHDRYLASDAFWVWKEESQGAWGVFDHAGDTWTERPQVVHWLSRVHAARIAGTVDDNAFDHVTGMLTLRTHGANRPHSIYVPGSATATCDGDTLDDLSSGFTDVTCHGTLVVTPR